jgi:fructokinase
MRNYEINKTPIFGAIETGGTKIICALGYGCNILERVSIKTDTPDISVPYILDIFLRWQENYHLQSIGLGMFGPIYQQRGHARDGEVIASPKLAWNGHNLASELRNSLQIPVYVESDVGVAALGEQRWGNAKGFSDFIYVTIGTGVGAAVMHKNRLFHGGSGLELGHSYVPSILKNDIFLGICPYHNNCLEGLVSGPAIKELWGTSPELLPSDHSCWNSLSVTVAHALATWSFCFSPLRIILGGGLGSRKELLFGTRLNLAVLLGGYGAFSSKNLKMSEYLVAPHLGNDAGIIGALELANCG